MNSQLSQALHGVNLGGWLVLERWMTPRLFQDTDACDEYTFMQTPNAGEKLDRHRQTFIQEEDWQWLAKNGINAVRIPVGYWIIHGDGPYAAGIQYLDWAFLMAEKYDVQVLIDLHGAVGSQNGKDHSGKIGRAEWFQSKRAREQTIEVLRELHERYKTSPNYWGLQLLNEPPLRLFHRKLRRFYRQAAKALDGDQQKIIFHDGFTPLLLSGALKRDARAVMDIHLYHMASWLAYFLSVRQFVRLSSWWYTALLRHVSRKQPVIIGEWSVVLRGDRLKNISPPDARELMYEFGRRQLAVYERESVGWFYWSYKTEGRGIWNFRSLVEDGRLEISPTP